MEQQKETPYRVGEWLPSDRLVLENWLKDLIVEVENTPKPMHPVILELKDLIESDPKLFMLFTLMFQQVPEKYKHNPAGGPQVRNYLQALQLINTVLTKAPEFNLSGLVGFPINAIFDYAMGTHAGFAAFLDAGLNKQLKKVLNAWGTFLKSADSVYVLNKNPRSGWFGEDARKQMPHFDEEFQCDPLAPYHGFVSWDDFFTRKFREGVRPVASPDDDAIIVNACESAPYRMSVNVHHKDTFWIKGQPYSLGHMLNHDSWTPIFEGGTIYQAFLSALSYHRWHSPVSGTIKKAYVIDGTYYSETPAEGYDPSGPNKSQGFITEVATRALIFIEADNPNIGLMCFMPVGMAEVSTCDITVYEGQHVKKGQEIGMFHFGGSTHCLIFQPKVKLDFDFHGQTPGLNSSNIPINSRIATVLK
ncbi:MAG TPA: phosphatidylserine decarboxylase family protein [Flavobacteriaceae bacterium]|nr:phosphatidylserine decarboxylase family protein [Flavobacteriaceae bacterium]MCB9212365.1 phosphatidylserine decarboxylase family protein [Alteromonas sp.]HPF11641.1 phosphatidylserine decarboxylase family protein [Flavobacteriaceae bacterium]HQU20116.1 phosphatidylserine decarboxylase family protein [Flavobacteriaceae bacterium]HQU64795.1 phosphatidylserine decarboxylase family protein [Flavobacteriaceae bacterium]